jgi:cytochrome b561
MSSKLRYDPIARTFHGVMAVLMIGLLGIGLYMEDLDPSPAKWQIYSLHKAFGITVLALVILRILWRALHTSPAALASQAAWERGLARVVHYLLYFGMVMMPISGYVMSSAGGHAISIFGLFDLPLLVEKNKDIGGLAKEIHEIAGFALIAAIALHFIGALKHHIIDRDATLTRMFAFIRAH